MNTEQSPGAPPQKRLNEVVGEQVATFRISRRRAVILIALFISLLVFVPAIPPISRFELLASLQANRMLVTLLLLFGLVTLSLLWSWGQQIDVWVFMRFNLHGYHPRWMDRLMWAATQIGSMFFAVGFAAVAYLLGHIQFAIVLMLGVLTLWWFVELIKALTDRARPFRLLENTRIVGWQEPGRSFPSGHTAQTFFVASFFIHYGKLGLDAIVAVYAIAVFVGMTRMYVGAHYPRDVLAGATLGLVWAILGLVIAPYLGA